MLFEELPICPVCGKSFSRRRIDQMHCGTQECRRAYWNAYKAAKRLEAGHVPIGSALTCQNCGKSCTKVHKRQFYCEACMVLCATEQLPKAKKRINTYACNYYKQKRQDDPRFAVRQRMSAHINMSLRDGKEGRSWEALVGYTITDLMRHLERQFLKGMTWENRDQWHIDHIVPLKCFHYETADDPEFRAAWALSNLRPLWGRDNIVKSGKRQHLL
jgi:hypothetical protein